MPDTGVRGQHRKQHEQRCSQTHDALASE